MEKEDKPTEDFLMVYPDLMNKAIESGLSYSEYLLFMYIVSWAQRLEKVHTEASIRMLPFISNNDIMGTMHISICTAKKSIANLILKGYIHIHHDKKYANGSIQKRKFIVIDQSHLKRYSLTKTQTLLANGIEALNDNQKQQKSLQQETLYLNMADYKASFAEYSKRLGNINYALKEVLYAINQCAYRHNGIPMSWDGKFYALVKKNISLATPYDYRRLTMFAQQYTGVTFFIDFIKYEKTTPTIEVPPEIMTFQQFITNLQAKQNTTAKGATM